MSVRGCVEDAARRVQNLSHNLDCLSRFCTVFCGPHERALRAVLHHLEHIVRSADSDPDGPHSEAAVRAYLELRALMLSDYSENGLDLCHPLREFLLERLLIDEHIFLQHSARLPIEQIDAGITALMQADLRALQALVHVDEGMTNLTGLDLRRVSRESDASFRRPPVEPETRHPWDLAMARDELKQRFRVEPDWSRLVGELASFCLTHGCGRHQGTPAFRLGSADDGDLELVPLEHFSSFDLAWLEGNASRIQILETNTRNLLDGYGAQNALVWGPRGCGKSSLIRGLITKYYNDGLRGIEVGPNLYSRLPELYALLRGRRQFYIAVLDNISLDRVGREHRYLSSLLDGGMEDKPPNLVFYATSNFKDLIDREGEKQQGPPLTARPGSREVISGVSGAQAYADPQGKERLDERRAIDDRFALKVFIDLPGKSDYENMVKSYARRASVDMPEEELLAEFEVWRMRHNHDLAGGRTARDFIAANFRSLTKERGNGDTDPGSPNNFG